MRAALSFAVVDCPALVRFQRRRWLGPASSGPADGASTADVGRHELPASSTALKGARLSAAPGVDASAAALEAGIESDLDIPVGGWTQPGEASPQVPAADSPAGPTAAAAGDDDTVVVPAPLNGNDGKRS